MSTTLLSLAVWTTASVALMMVGVSGQRSGRPGDQGRISAYVTLNDLKEIEPVPGFKGRFVHSDHMTLAYWNVAAGAVLPQHAHVHEQITNLIEGEFEMTVAGEVKVLRPGEVAVIPSNVPHSARALTQCRIIDAFYPVREDYRDATR
jgi:quercetin dioxygenase-like cupin family protein